MSKQILLDRRGNVATVTVNRPEKRNAMDAELRDRLRDAITAVADDSTVRCLVLRGAGEAFIAGGDLGSFADFDRVDAFEYATSGSPALFDGLAALSKPTIAAVDGAAIGGGMELALACDIRLATHDATFSLPEVTMGTLPMGGGTRRLPQIVGAGIAKELVLTGRTVDADEAEEIGLVNHVYPDDDFERQLRELADDVASNAPLAQQLAKAAIDSGLARDRRVDVERIAGAFLFGTDDFAEGISAAIDGRTPEYRGR